MSPEEQNRAIAESIGAKYHRPTEAEVASGSYYQYEPNYVGDLNAMHAVIADLPSDGSWGMFLTRLAKITGGFGQPDTTRDMLMVQATAAQRAEAYLRTIGKWKD